jgi:hypothetical protein
MEEHIQRMLPFLDERQKRLFLASEAKAYGYGGVSEMSRISGMSRTTITRGIAELENGAKYSDKVRQVGGGRRYIEENHPDIVERIRAVIDDETYGDPMKVISYTTESQRGIAKKLGEQGIEVNYTTIGKIIESMGYSKQANQKMMQVGEPHPNRNAQFEYINKTAADYIKAGIPVISVDTKKKENIGNFRNNGQEYRPKRQPRTVLDHDFPVAELGKIAPSGVYNLISRNYDYAGRVIPKAARIFRGRGPVSV